MMEIFRPKLRVNSRYVFPVTNPVQYVFLGHAYRTRFSIGQVHIQRVTMTQKEKHYMITISHLEDERKSGNQTQTER